MFVPFARRLRLGVFRWYHREGLVYECPVCGYIGPFKDVRSQTGLRHAAQCPSCRALERHRLQFLVCEQVFTGRSTGGMKMLHMAPEPIFRQYFAQRFGAYETADLVMQGVDHHVDLQQLPFGDASYDMVFASHVLEHVPDDGRAISEIRRILRPSGIAILPVPVVAEKTVEYDAPNPHEHGHVRAPGADYFERYRKCFSKVETYASDAWPARYQLHIFEDRSRWPTDLSPQRPPMEGDRHVDIVPVCYA